jgi:hypothetical protein
MAATIRSVWNHVFTCAALAALTFGASQALADGPEEPALRVCTTSTCRQYCVSTCPPEAGSCFGSCLGGQCRCQYSF